MVAGTGVGVLTGGGTVDAPMGRHAGDRRKMTIRDDGKPAVTHYSVIRRFQRHCHLDLELESGRTHQIRVHAAHLGHPVCADDRYGDPIFNQRMADKGATRLFLHAAELEFAHPITNSKITVVADEPPELTVVRQRLGAFKD